MHRITKEFQFDSCHMLEQHQGKCHNLHGHTYRLQVTITGNLIQTGTSSGMVMDFADLKTMVHTLIIEPMDHAFLYNQHSPNELQLAQLLFSMQRKVFALPNHTTAENLSQFIAQRLSPHVPLSKITLWETPTAYCEYEVAP